MVNLVEDWEILEEYAGDKQGFYQIIYGGKGVEIRVAVGRLGFKEEFESWKPLRDFLSIFSYLLYNINIRKFQKKTS